MRVLTPEIFHPKFHALNSCIAKLCSRRIQYCLIILYNTEDSALDCWLVGVFFFFDIYVHTANFEKRQTFQRSSNGHRFPLQVQVLSYQPHVTKSTIVLLSGLAGVSLHSPCHVRGRTTHSFGCGAKLPRRNSLPKRTLTLRHETTSEEQRTRMRRIRSCTHANIRASAI